MIKGAAILFCVLLSTDYVPKRTVTNADYITVGQNLVQKIGYSTSTSSNKSHRGDKTIDCNVGTAWVSRKSSYPHWVEIDFGVKRIMTSIVVYPGKRNNYKTVKYFILQFLYRDKWFNFTRVDLDKSIFYKKRAVIDLGGIDASAFRILIPSGATYQGYAAISEIETYIGSSKLNIYDERLKGLHFPVRNGFLPEKDSRYPNAPRTYRGGRHAGIDIFYYHTDDSYEPVPVTVKTPIYAADGGRIIRADWNYTPPSQEEWRKRSKYYRSHPATFVKRSFGGRQVWIDHENGVVTTYNHLSRIEPAVKKESRVRKGQVIGWAGNSGLLPEARANNENIHLHFEIWVDGYYLGYGMKSREVKRYIKWMFFPLQ
ncbi:MAG: peptidoglycan DD-metalloendopeptidase family protein [bacterium]|nr:peptidoglycan DD-metalloendopeptidase family protein [bacterium]